jgi:hypothetical protein
MFEKPSVLDLREVAHRLDTTSPIGVALMLQPRKGRFSPVAERFLLGPASAWQYAMAHCTPTSVRLKP